MIDIEEKKNKIISLLETSGPSLPVQIARAIGMDPVFASAITSELISQKKITTSHMKIGASPLYLIPGQEQKLENQADGLKPIEKEAYLKLKENKIISDENEEPAIRVALRNIKDFAKPFKFKEKIIWRYKFTPEEEIEKLLSKPKEKRKKEPEEIPKAWEGKKVEINQIKEEQKKVENIFEKSKKENIKKTFLKEIEEFLEDKGTKIISIEEVDKRKVVAKTQKESQTALLFAFNKKRITEEELIKCYRKAKTLNLPYHIITKNEPTKKMSETIDAYKKLLGINKLNDNNHNTYK